MNSSRRLLLLACCLFSVKQVACNSGPVFINPNVVAVAPTPSSTVTNEANYVTQTVYGFLDFTTTIGNTVMVFSPQSATVSESSIEKVVEVIETKASKLETTEIKPTQVVKEKQAKISSIVQVHSEIPVKAVESSKVNVIEESRSNIIVINTVSSEIGTISSKVEVVKIEPSKPSLSSTENIITKVQVISAVAKSEPSIVSSKVEILSKEPIISSVIEVKSISNDEEPAIIIGNNIGEPEYDFLSRQPSEVVEETYKVINLKPSSKFHLKPRPSAEVKNKLPATIKRDSLHPTGLVTKLGGTVVKDGTTTVHETSVIGTYISGKYAQVLQSSSHIVNQHKKNKINPSPTLRILKTAAPTLGKSGNKHRHLEPTPAGSINEETALPVENLFNSQNSIKATVRKGTATTTGSAAGTSFKPRFKNRQKEIDIEEDGNEQDIPNYKKSQRRSQTSRTSNKHNISHRPYKFGRNRKTTTTTTTVSVHSEEVTTAPSFSNGKRYQSRRNKQNRPNSSSTSSESNNVYSRRGYKPKVQTSAVEQNTATTSLYKFKLNRSPGRWQYKTTPKPRIIIRKQNEDEPNNNTNAATLPTTSTNLQDVSQQFNDIGVTPQARSDDVDGLEGSESVASIIDDGSSTENKVDTAPFPLETLKVEISTPPNFKDVYYEIATIKSPYTFQVGNVKNTRYITVTSTFEKSLVNTAEAAISSSATEPLTENILATSSNYGKDNNFLDSSIATLPPIYLASDMETPPLETLTETFSTTQTMLKTHILPVVHSGNETTSSTLVQTYLVTRLVTATKTLPPMEAYHFIPSKKLNEYNSHLDEAGSELHLELEFGDENEQDEDIEAIKKKTFPPDLDLSNIGKDFDVSDVDKSKIPEMHLRLKKAPPKPAINEPLPTPGLNPDQLQQLALLRLLNPAGQGQVITTSKPILKVETLYESHVIPITNGLNTIHSTISKILGTVTKTDYEFGTSTLAAAPLPIPPIPPVNPLFQPQFAITTSPIVQSTILTQTNSKILKLTFGAKTAYTTIFSTKIVPTLVTTFMTASVPVQPTAAYPGFFPAPYPGYPFVG